MQKMFKKPHDIMLYTERNEFEEFGRAKPDFRECRTCGAVYFKKSWHHPKSLESRKDRSTMAFWLTRCPACKMVENKQFEGMVTIQNVPKKLSDELQHMIMGYARRAYDHDCQHRLIAFNKEDAKTWTVSFTENQLANKLAQKIKETFDKVEVKVSYSEQPNDVERVNINFKPFWSLLPDAGR